MIFYRLQSNEYTIDENSISFNCNFETLEEAMRNDILDFEFINENKLNELLKTKSLLEIWREEKQKGSLIGWVEPAVCCFKEPLKLVNYYYDTFEMYINNIFNKSDLDYILIFEGTFVDFGSEGEECSKFIKEIERLKPTEFLEKYNLNYLFNKEV